MGGGCSSSASAAEPGYQGESEGRSALRTTSEASEAVTQRHARWVTALEEATIAHEGLQGAQADAVRCRADGAKYVEERGVYHQWFHFPWGRGAHTNCSAGCSIALQLKRYAKASITNSDAPPRHLQGRGGMIQLAQGDHRVRLIVAYFAPKPGLLLQPCPRNRLGHRHDGAQLRLTGKEGDGEGEGVSASAGVTSVNGARLSGALGAAETHGHVSSGQG